jgi:ATP-dependent Zn protease
MGTELQSRQLPADDYSMSDATRRMVDEEQQYITDLAHRRATRLVAENRGLLEALALTLLENEMLERDDIERLVNAHGPGGEGASPPADPVAGDSSEQVRLAASERLDG